MFTPKQERNHESKGGRNQADPESRAQRTQDVRSKGVEEWARWSSTLISCSISNFESFNLVHENLEIIDFRNISDKHEQCLRVVHGSDGPAGRVGSRVTILPDFGGSGRVSTSDFSFFYWLFLSTWIDMNLRILHEDRLIFYDI